MKCSVAVLFLALTSMTRLVAVAEGPSIADEEVVRYLKDVESSIHSIHILWHEVAVANLASGKPIEAHTDRELWGLSTGFRYQVTGELFNAQKGVLQPLRQEVVDDGNNRTTFSHDFNGKGARGAVVTASADETPSIQFLAPAVSIMPFKVALGGIKEGGFTVARPDQFGMTVLKEMRSNNSVRQYYYRPRDGRWSLERVEVIIGGRPKYVLTIEYGSEAVNNLLLPTRWVLAKLGPQSVVVESATSTVSKIEINPAVDSSILVIDMPEGTALTDATTANPAFAYVGPEGRKLPVSNGEVKLTYDEVREARRRSYLSYLIATAVLILALVAIAWCFFVYPRKSQLNRRSG